MTPLARSLATSSSGRWSSPRGSPRSRRRARVLWTDSPGCSAHPPHDVLHPDRPQVLVLDGGDELQGLHLGVVKELARLVDRGDGRSGLLEGGDDLLACGPRSTRPRSRRADRRAGLACVRARTTVRRSLPGARRAASPARRSGSRWWRSRANGRLASGRCSGRVVQGSISRTVLVDAELVGVDDAGADRRHDRRQEVEVDFLAPPSLSRWYSAIDTAAAPATPAIESARPKAGSVGGPSGCP